MPGWIWWILALFMILMLVIGAIYAIRHAMAAMRTVSAIGSQASERFALMQVDTHDIADVPAPSFTQPLKHTADQYADAHAQVIERKERRRDRHAQTWNHWRQY